MGTSPYYEEPGIQIFHGDCREILPSLGKFDLLLTDPPYGTGGIAYGRGSARGGHCNWPRRTTAEPAIEGDIGPFDPAHLLAAASASILWGANWYADALPRSPMWLAWDRKCERAPETTTTDCELAWVSGHTYRTVRIFRHMWAGFQRDSELGRRVLHPTQKPVALMSWCLGFFPEAKTVIDPYMGSGPVAKACKDRGLKYVGIELVEKYCEIAAKRLAQEVLFA